RRLPPVYLAEIVSHRHLRYGSGLLHLVLLGTNVALVAMRAGVLYDVALGLQVAFLAVALLRARHLGDRRRALELHAARRARDLGPRGRDALNRALDVAGAGALLLGASPLLGLAALAIRLEDGGPVLYRQTRVGKDGRDFELLKLRTMVVGAERQGAGF